MVGPHGDVPADLKSPGDDRFAEMSGGGTKRRGRDGERGFPRLAGLETRGDGWLEEGVVREEIPGGFDPALGKGDLAFRVVMVFRAAHLVQPEPHKPQVGLAARDGLARDEPDSAGYPIADACRLVECDLANHRAVRRSEEFLGTDRVEGVAALAAGQARTVQGIERRWRGSRVATKDAAGEDAHHH